MRSRGVAPDAPVPSRHGAACSSLTGQGGPGKHRKLDVRAALAFNTLRIPESTLGEVTSREALGSSFVDGGRAP